jgi:hypothetical protein
LGNGTTENQASPVEGVGSYVIHSELLDPVSHTDAPTRDLVGGILTQKQPPEYIGQQAIHALALHGLTDRISLFDFGVVQFRNSDFPPFGKGTALASAVLGKTVTKLNLEHLNRIAEALSLPHLSELTRQRFLAALSVHGITDSLSLFFYGIKKFRKSDFSPFGEGAAFASIVLGETVHNVNLPHLKRIVGVLSLPRLSESTRQRFLAAFSAYGITDKISLITFGVQRFQNSDFRPFGKGGAFASKILGGTAWPLQLEHLKRIAEILSLPRLSESTRQRLLAALSTHSITDRQSLINFGVEEFQKADFSPFGKGRDFACAILDESLTQITLEHLGHIADIIFGEEK